MNISIRTCLLFIVSAVSCLADGRVAAFSNLPKGDTIAIRFSSGGCFHSFTYDLVFSASGSGSFEVHEVHFAQPNPKQSRIEEFRKYVGRISLEPSEAKRIDAVIAFYRTNSDSGCTTIDSIRLRQIHAGRVVAEESFVDASCATLMQADLLTFGRILSALREAKR